jgi:DNA-binding NarL/FixJ family response regulator
MKKLRILLADDHVVMREGLKLLVNAQTDMEVVGEASDGKQALQKAGELQPDVVVMDISMPELNGAQATERVKKRDPSVKVLALTMHEDEDHLRQLLKAGASGYVIKHAAAEELTQAIRLVAAGGMYIAPTLASKMVDSYVRAPSPESEPRSSDLSAREAEVMRLIAQGFTNKEIAVRLRLSIKTVETYKTRLMEKLDLRSRADIVRYALRQGWLQEE